MITEPFAAFCNRVAGTIDVEIDPNKTYNMPEHLIPAANNLVKTVRRSIPTFATYPIPSIQKIFLDMDEVEKTLKEKCAETNDEIPDEYFVYFAYKIFSKNETEIIGYNNLPLPFKNIIKVVATYFMLQV